jgi:squalene synthase HpnC
MYAGRAASHPVFVALRQTAERHALPIDPFDNLITAFEQDQRITRYANWAELDAYCVNSANPVGRLVLMLGGYRDQERFLLADATCTALQLANFWQDVAVDLGKGRIYLPLDLLARHGYTERQLFARECTPEFRALLREAVDRAQTLFDEGQKLVPILDRRLALDIDLFNRGGMKILAKIRALDYDVLGRRPTVTKRDAIALLAGALARWLWRARR